MSTLTIGQTALAHATFSRVGSCWICDGGNLHPAYPALLRLSEVLKNDPELGTYAGRQIWMQRCSRCGFTQPEALPALPDFFDRLYNQLWLDPWLEEEFQSTYKDYIFDEILRTLDRLLPAENRTLLDIGTHVGRFILLAKERGWHCEGIEPNPRSAAYAREHTGSLIHRVMARELACLERNYSAITLLDVLEHIPEPLSVLRAAAKMLRPDGWMAVKVPCAPAQQLKERARSYLSRGYPPTAQLAENLVHISHFSPRSLKLALERGGFRNISITIGAPEVFDLRRGADTWNRRVANLFRLGVYHAGRLLPGGIYSPLALHLQAYAQRT